MTRPRIHHERLWGSDHGLTALLALLVLNMFVLYPLVGLGVLGNLFIHIVFTGVLLSGVAATARRRGPVLAVASFAVLSFVLRWTSFVRPAYGLAIANAGAALLFSLLLGGLILVRVFSAGPVTRQRIEGAIAVYLLIALAWGAAYELCALVSPGALVATSTGSALPPEPVSSFMYFSFVTLTTVGYGDIVAVHPATRMLASLEALVGQLFPAILLARLVAMEVYYRQQQHERAGEDDRRR